MFIEPVSGDKKGIYKAILLFKEVIVYEMEEGMRNNSLETSKCHRCCENSLSIIQGENEGGRLWAAGSIFQFPFLCLPSA